MSTSADDDINPTVHKYLQQATHSLEVRIMKITGKTLATTGSGKQKNMDTSAATISNEQASGNTGQRGEHEQGHSLNREQASRKSDNSTRTGVYVEESDSDNEFREPMLDSL